MRGLICDACGQPYKGYHWTNIEARKDVYDDSAIGVNGFTLVHTDKDMKMHLKARYDLCDTCMQKMVLYLQNDLIDADNGRKLPFYNPNVTRDASRNSNGSADTAVAYTDGDMNHSIQVDTAEAYVGKE